MSKKIKQAWTRLSHVLSTPQKRLLATISLVFLISSMAFVAIADEVKEAETLQIDTAILQAVRRLASPFLDAIIPVITNLGGVTGVVSILAIASVALIVKKRYANALFGLIAVGGAALSNIILKAIFQRDRPQLWERIVTENSFSFPSGHAMASMALALAIVALFWHTRYRFAVSIVAFLYVIVIAFTRMYLGVHYPTDIIAGWCVSMAWVLMVWYIFRRYRVRSKVIK